MMKKYLFISLTLILTGFAFYAGCGDIDRSNLLDPENDNAIAGQVTVVENFVHRYTSGDSVNRYIAYSQQALYDLKQEYEDKVIILEYHMLLADTSKKDTLATGDNQLRYQNEYKPGTAPRAFPHAFFNGKHTDIQGASSFETARQRYKIILDTLTVKKVKLYGDAKKSFEDNTLKINCKIARYGDKKISDLLIEYIVIENLGNLTWYTVRKILSPESIAEILPGDVYELPEKNVSTSELTNTANTDVVILIKDNITKKIIQACVAR